jgi:plastocyanin
MGASTSIQHTSTTHRSKLDLALVRLNAGHDVTLVRLKAGHDVTLVRLKPDTTPRSSG